MQISLPFASVDGAVDQTTPAKAPVRGEGAFETVLAGETATEMVLQAKDQPGTALTETQLTAAIQSDGVQIGRYIFDAETLGELASSKQFPLQGPTIPSPKGPMNEPGEAEAVHTDDIALPAISQTSTEWTSESVVVEVIGAKIPTEDEISKAGRQIDKADVPTDHKGEKAASVPGGAVAAPILPIQTHVSPEGHDAPVQSDKTASVPHAGGTAMRPDGPKDTMAPARWTDLPNFVAAQNVSDAGPTAPLNVAHTTDRTGRKATETQQVGAQTTVPKGPAEEKSVVATEGAELLGKASEKQSTEVVARHARTGVLASPEAENLPEEKPAANSRVRPENPGTKETSEGSFAPQAAERRDAVRPSQDTQTTQPPPTPAGAAAQPADAPTPMPLASDNAQTVQNARPAPFASQNGKGAGFRDRETQRFESVESEPTIAPDRRAPQHPTDTRFDARLENANAVTTADASLQVSDASAPRSELFNSDQGLSSISPLTPHSQHSTSVAALSSVFRAPDMPAAVAAQLVDAARALGDRPMELSLSPEELGKVRLTMSTHDGGMAVAVAVERPETLDLLRRNIGDLEAQFRNLGYQDVSFSFSQQGAGQNPQGEREARPGGTFAPVEATIGASPNEVTPVRVHLDGKRGIDIRL